MKKRYTNERCIPVSELYAKLIILFYGFCGLNFLLIYLCGKPFLDSKIANPCLILSILMFLLVPINIVDKRIENRGLLATTCAGLFHSSSTFIFIYLLSLRWLWIPYIIEILIIILLILNYYKQRKKK